MICIVIVIVQTSYLRYQQNWIKAKESHSKNSNILACLFYTLEKLKYTINVGLHFNELTNYNQTKWMIGRLLQIALP